MSDLIDKLNVLLRANLDNLLSRSGDGAPPPKRLPPEQLGKDVDREIAALRRQIDAALNKEEDIKGRLAALQGQIEQLDRAADAALERGDESAARANVRQMQDARKRAAALELELGRHRDATFDLIQHVNTLEAMVSDARHAEAQAKAQADLPASSPDKAQAGQGPQGQAEALPGKTATELLSDMLRSVRERVEEAVTPKPESAAPPEAAPGPAPAAPAKPAKATPGDDAEVEEDLARRRSRLS
ncbi:MAG: PspA/IM30 family protein [Anaerolineae bacterium]|nr:PspA/IM30 family protein [Anaerolineae bacterium]